MAKLTLALAPTFKAHVQIPVPGKRAASVEFTFKARTREDFFAWLESQAGRDDVDVLMDIICGWDLEDEFSRETVSQLVQFYIGSAKAISDTYMRESSGARLGN